MAGISSGGTIETVNLERLEFARHKAKGALGTLRDMAILRTQFATLRDTGLLHPVQTLRATAPTPTTIPTVGVLPGGSSSSSYDVVEHVIGGETEEGHVVRLLQHAYDAFANAEFEEGKNLLKQASFISSCARCGRGILGIEKLIEKGDLYEARRRLDALIGLIPAYYTIIEKESVFSDKGEAEKESGRGSEKAEEELEEVCEECRVSEILETCRWDVSCIDAVIRYAEELKAKGEKVLSDKLLNKAEEFTSRA
ncbi:hypothetical protein KAW18_17825 [candidate division WOR-3 bacterium]|nr:hypothetical protein [candidate division WOR-3 bacterium]